MHLMLLGGGQDKRAVTFGSFCKAFSILENNDDCNKTQFAKGPLQTKRGTSFRCCERDKSRKEEKVELPVCCGQVY